MLKDKPRITRSDADVAFDIALRAGRLSKQQGTPNYVGDYMYMGTASDGVSDAFKHIRTRQYLPLLGAYAQRHEVRE